MDMLISALDEGVKNAHVAKLESENATLLAEVKRLNKTLEEHKADEADVHFYLHKRLDDNYDVIAGLERRIVELETDLERTEREAKEDAEKKAAQDAAAAEKKAE